MIQQDTRALNIHKDHGKIVRDSSNNNYNQIYDNNLFNIYHIPEIFVNKLMTTCFRWPQPFK